MTPRVSILVPAYNVERFVAEAVESVRAQTFDDWELVAVDDASTDRTLEVLRSFTGSRMRVEQNPRNLGMTANWNRALSLARGTFVIKLDADDAFKPHAMSMLVESLGEASIFAAGMRTLTCDEAMEPFDGIQGDDVMMRGGIDPYGDSVHGGDEWYDLAAMGHQLWSSTALMLRRDDLVRLGGWDERFGCASDTELTWRVLEQGKPVAHRGKVGALYRIRKGSVSDEYRLRGWLTWEAAAANLLTLHRTRKRRALRRGLRMHYVRLWQRWKSEQKPLPEQMCTMLDAVVAEVDPPPWRDVVMTRARDAVTAR